MAAIKGATRITEATAVPLVAALGLAAAGWAVTAHQTSGMDMGPATPLGSLASFAALWVPMMAAMMLPGAAPALVRRARRGAAVQGLPVWLASYLAVWTFVGLAVYAGYRPHGSLIAAAAVIAAGCYEMTPLKRYFRRRCLEHTRSGFQFGLYCVGSSIGLMLMLVALGLMSPTWMTVTTVLVLAQKLLPARTSVDVPLALAIVAFGVWIAVAPASVPGITPAM